MGWVCYQYTYTLRRTKGAWPRVYRDGKPTGFYINEGSLSAHQTTTWGAGTSSAVIEAEEATRDWKAPGHLGADVVL